MFSLGVPGSSPRMWLHNGEYGVPWLQAAAVTLPLSQYPRLHRRRLAASKAESLRGVGHASGAIPTSRYVLGHEGLSLGLQTCQWRPVPPPSRRGVPRRQQVSGRDAVSTRNDAARKWCILFVDLDSGNYWIGHMSIKEYFP